MSRSGREAAAADTPSMTGDAGQSAASSSDQCDDAPPRKLTEPLQSPSDREIALYMVSFAGAFAYAAYSFHVAYGKGPNLDLQSDSDYMQPGWMADWMEKPPDPMEQEMLRHYRPLIAASIGFLLVSQLTLRKASRTTHYLATAAYTLALTTAAVNIRSAAYMLLLYSGSVCAGFFSLTGVWLLVLTAMTLQNSPHSREQLFEALGISETGGSLFIPIICYLYCRCISAGHSLNRVVRLQQQRPPALGDFLRVHLPRALAYGFYLPGYPMLTFDDFCREMDRPGRTVWDLGSAAAVLWRACRLLLWLLLLQALHHFLPVGAYLHSLQPGVSQQVPYKWLVLAMYMHGQNFMLLYVQLYGWPSLIARLDGIRLPHWPDCISRVYTYRQMWRVFDRGLAAFMQHHIYAPLGGSRRGRARQVAAVAACFAFVSVFHGDSWGVRIWSALNGAQLLLEVSACELYRTRVKAWLTSHLSPRNHQRLVAFIIGWNLIMTSCFIFLLLVEHNAYFFISEVFKPLVLQRPVWHLLLLLYLSYCSVQMSLRYERSDQCKRKRN